MKNNSSLIRWIYVLPLFFGTLNGHEILVNTQDGETFVLDVDPEASLRDLQDKIAALSNGKSSNLLIEIASTGKVKGYGLNMARSQGGYLGYPRNYLAEVTAEEKNDIRYIVTSLANKSLIAIALGKGDLEAAGDRIDHIHPLRFLMTVFTDEELKAGMRNIRGKGWIWNHFVSGLKESLVTETHIGNMKVEYVRDFAQIVRVDANIIIPSVLQQSWEDFLDLLITHIPRTGNCDRYDTRARS